MRVCGVMGCEAKHYAKDYCRKHYKWFIEYGHTELPRSTCEQCGGSLPMKYDAHARFCSSACRMKWYRRHGCYTRDAVLASRGACAISGCEDPVHAHGFCRKHAMRLWRHGDPDVFLAKRVSGQCEVDGCGKPAECGQCCKYHYFKKYIDEHREEWNAYRGARRSRVQKATPPWVDMKAIRAIYRTCARVTLQTGVEHHVDHIVPIKGRGVRGLHVPWNLQILPGADNRRKSNRM